MTNAVTNIQPVDLERSISANIKRAPRELATLARKAIDAAERNGKLMIEDYLRAGRFLHALKRRMGHGAWLPHLEAEGINERKAQRLMLLATEDRAVIEYLNSDENGEPSFRGAHEAAQKARREPIEDLQSDEMGEGEAVAFAKPASARRVKHKSERGAHQKFMIKAEKLLGELRAAVADGEPMRGVIGHMQDELRELEHRTREALEGEKAAEQNVFLQELIATAPADDAKELTEKWTPPELSPFEATLQALAKPAKKRKPKLAPRHQVRRDPEE